MNTVSPEKATFSKAAAAAAAVVFTVSSSNVAATVNVVKNGGAVVNAANYNIAAGKVTLKKEYLTTLTNGDKTFTFAMSAGDDLTVIVTVAD